MKISENEELNSHRVNKSERWRLSVGMAYRWLRASSGRWGGGCRGAGRCGCGGGSGAGCGRGWA